MITVFTFPRVCLPGGLAGSGCWNGAGRPIRWGGGREALGPGRWREASPGRAASPRPPAQAGAAAREGEGKAGLGAMDNLLWRRNLPVQGRGSAWCHGSRQGCAGVTDSRPGFRENFCLYFKISDILHINKIATCH